MNKMYPVRFHVLLIFAIVFSCVTLPAQTPTGNRILIDVSHAQKFWNDPADMKGMDPNMVERVKYMTGEIKKSAASAGSEVGYLKGKITSDKLEKADLLFVHIPSTKYDAQEIEAIHHYLGNGGALFLVMEVDYWSTLEQANVNDIVTPFGIRFGGQIPDSLSGGYTSAGPITPRPLKVTYHGARAVTGGTPFCFSNQSKSPFGTFLQLSSGGKMVVMGDGMVSLYMTSWNGVDDYQCSEFMGDVFAWLLKD
jgi:hypothetical protein